ncbi:MAG: hypothetical protein EHM59_14140 [Betaproteobacteria bacterium]|nr:MAG: hypothetical protein EHM59_14140 [Betaproteobacteria bacterium]
MRSAARAPFVLLGIASLLIGMAGGLARIGYAVPLPLGSALEHHGALMVGGFFGTLISLERAVALGSSWTYAGPIAAGLSALLITGGALALGEALLLAGSLVLCAASATVWRKQPTLFNAVLTSGALCWAIGNGLRLGGAPVAGAVAWWIAFFVLTIAGERLELNRLLPPKPHATRAFVVIAAVLVVGCALASVRAPAGVFVFAFALLAMGGWLLRNDVARRTIRARALTRYIAASLLSGYVWLLLGAGLMMGESALAGAGLVYDAALHAIFVGFVFAMVFGHAPIIFPALMQIRIRYTPWLYVPLGLLHASLILRIAGDLAAFPTWRLAGALGNVAAILLFALTMVTCALLGRRAGVAPHNR